MNAAPHLSRAQSIDFKTIWWRAGIDPTGLILCVLFKRNDGAIRKIKKKICRNKRRLQPTWMKRKAGRRDSSRLFNIRTADGRIRAGTRPLLDASRSKWKENIMPAFRAVPLFFSFCVYSRQLALAAAVPSHSRVCASVSWALFQSNQDGVRFFPVAIVPSFGAGGFSCCGPDAATAGSLISFGLPFPAGTWYPACSFIYTLFSIFSLLFRAAR